MSKKSKDQSEQSPLDSTSLSRQYHHGDLRNALVQAGIEVLADEGAGGLNLRKVARKAGVSEAAPYRHFEDKQALLAAIAQDGFQRLTLQMEEALQGSSNSIQAQLLSLAYAYVQFGLENPAIMREMFSGLMITRSAYPDLQMAAHECCAILSSVITSGQEQGKIQPGDSKAIFLVFWSTIHGQTMLLLEKQMPAVLEDESALRSLIALSIKALCDGLC